LSRHAANPQPQPSTTADLVPSRQGMRLMRPVLSNTRGTSNFRTPPCIALPNAWPNSPLAMPHDARSLSICVGSNPCNLHSSDCCNIRLRFVIQNGREPLFFVMQGQWLRCTCLLIHFTLACGSTMMDSRSGSMPSEAIFS
jgi:hypothetical protein